MPRKAGKDTKNAAETPASTELSEKVTRILAKARALKSELVRRTIVVTHLQEVVVQFGATPAGRMPPGPDQPLHLDDVIDQVVKRSRAGGPDSPDRGETGEPTRTSRDFAVWRDRRLIAVVLSTGDEEPVVIRFEA